MKPATRGVKVLVIDDSNTIRRSAEIFLKQGGYEVLLAEDGFDALSKVNDHDPDLIFCDILMPRSTATRPGAIIKRNAKFAGVPVIMLSSKDGLFDKARGRNGRLAGLSHETIHEGPASAGVEEHRRGPQPDARPRRRACADRCPPLHPPREDITMTIQKILLVDDSKTELHYLSELLGKRG
jgi:twitching motility two-component system response regulator PilG